MTPIGVVGIAIGVIIFVRGMFFLRTRRRTVETMFVWLIVGISITILSADPRIVSPYVSLFGFQESSVLILIIGVLFLTLLVFWMYNMIFDLKEKVKILHDNLSIILSDRVSDGQYSAIKEKDPADSAKEPR